MGEAEMCPLCGGEITSGECPSCGFVIPDPDEIAAPYDLDPSNDRFGEADPTEGMFPCINADADADAEEPGYGIPSVSLPGVPSINPAGKPASASIRPLPNIRVRVSPGVRHVQPVQPAAPTPAPSAVSLQPPKPAGSPAVRLVKAVSDFAAKHWYKLAAAFVAPTSGIIIGAVYLYIFYSLRKRGDLLKGLLFVTVGLLLLLEGFDPLGLDLFLRQVLGAVFGE